MPLVLSFFRYSNSHFSLIADVIFPSEYISSLFVGIGGVIDFQKFDFVICVGIMLENAKMLILLFKCLCSNSYILNCRPDESWRTRHATIVCKMGSIWCLNSCFSKPTGLISCFRVPIWSFLLVLEYYVENHWFLSVQWNPDGLDMPQNAISLDMPRFSNSWFFISTCFVFPSSSHSIPFYLKQYLLFVSKYHKKIFSTSKLESLHDQEWQRCYS